MDARALMLRLAVVTPLAIGLWLPLRADLDRAIHLIVTSATFVAGEDVAPTMVDGKATMTVRRRGLYADVLAVELGRWHANLAAFPILVMIPSRLSTRRRLLMLLVGTPLVLVLDGCAAFAFLWSHVGLERQSASGADLRAEVTVILAASMYAPKIIPVAVWLGCYVAMNPPPAMRRPD